MILHCESNLIQILESLKQFPKNVAIVMDGNRRWAKLQNKENDAITGHRAGYNALRKLLTFISKTQLLDLQSLTVYAFSKENWSRSAHEVEGLMALALHCFLHEAIEIEDFKIKVVGDIDSLDQNLRDASRVAELKTSKNTGPTLFIALNYSGVWDLTEGFKEFNRQNKDIPTESIDCSFESIQKYLPSSSIPPTDLFIRTGGETRLSNFLPLQLAYAELYFDNCLWPDFTECEFVKAIQFYDKKQRRFGV